MKIAVVGTGYVGLVVGTGLAEIGHTVVCVDREPAQIEQLAAGKAPIYEPGLEELLVRNIEEERLAFTTDLARAVGDCLVVFICVGTPAHADGTLDVSEVMGATEEIGRAMTGYRIVVNKSTSPVGTAERIRARLTEVTAHAFDVVVNPEFLKEGDAVDDFMRPDRIIIGCEDVRVQEIMKEMYAPLLRTGNPLICMTLRSAEMAKLAVNVMLAARIALMNELAEVCEAVGADIGHIRESIATDGRIGSAYLHAGLGFGGSCLPKDVVAAARLAQQAGVQYDVFDVLARANQAHLEHFIRRIVDYYSPSASGKRLAIWGGTFKARTDDIRGSAAVRIINALLEAGASVLVYDPVAGRKLHDAYGDRIRVVAKNYAALEGADGLIIATEWREFYRPDFDRMGSLMREKVIFDGRNLYTPKSVAQHGFRYISIGRPSIG